MNIKRKMGLGKGLSSLLSESPADIVPEEDESFEISIDAIETNPYQPRTQFDQETLEELSDSIRVQGVIQPIAVRKIGDKYQLISGERRLKASQLAGLKSIPAYIREASDAQMLELGLIENVQRENLNPMEIAMAYKRLQVECSLKLEELAARVGKNRSTVNNFLRLLSLPQAVQEGLAENKLSMGHARALLGLEQEEQMLKVYQEVLARNLSVRKVEELVKRMLTKPSPNKKASTPADPKKFLESYQQYFGEIFGKKVVVQADAQQKGEIKIQYSSRAELDQIMEKLK
jgi:ParB family chromosome partitioning protein